MKKKILITLFLSFVLISFLSAGFDFNKKEIKDFNGNSVSKGNSYIWEIEGSSVTYKNPDGTYTKTLLSGTQYVEDSDGKWKRIEEASSLKNSNIKIKFIETDPNYEIEIIDYNLTSIKYNLKIKDQEKNKDIQVRIWDVNETKKLEKASEVNKEELEKSYKEYSQKTEDKFIKQLENSEEHVEEIGINKILEIGGHSTTITLQDANTENLEDVGICNSPYSSCAGSVNNSIIIKFDFSSIVNSYNISYSNLSMYNDGFSSGLSQLNISGIANQTWREENNVNTLKVMTSRDEQTYSIVASGSKWESFNITTQTNSCLTNSENNCSFRLSKVDDTFTSQNTSVPSAVEFYVGDRGDNYITLYSKENTWGDLPYKRPKLTITYTPYIDILSPTPSQIFTQDAPTTHLNISTAVAMDTCYWSNNSGATNYSMTEVNSTYFYNDTAGSILLDGSHSVKFYCNESSDGTWRSSDSVSFDVDSVNVTVCRDLSVNREYNLLNNVTSTGNCFTLKNSFNFYGNNHFIIGGSNAFYNNLGSNFIINNANYQGVGNFIDTFISSFSLLLYDSNLGGGSLGIHSGSIANLTNVTNPDEAITGSGIIYRKWYTSVQVNGTDGYLSGANVTIYNISGSAVYSGLTNSSGQIPKQELIEYKNLGGTKTYSTPHTINISKTGYLTNSTIFNISDVNNINHIVKLVRFAPTILSPLPQTYATNESLELNWSYVNSTEIDKVWYKVVNSTGATIIDNTFLTLNTNTTFNVSQGEGTYTLTIYMNDTIGNQNSDSVTFGISLTAPATVLDYPTNNKAFNSPNNIYFNFTSTDPDDITNCKLYHNYSGTWLANYTWDNMGAGVQNYTSVNFSSDKTFIWNVWCNDTLGNNGFGLNNRTLIIDTTTPIVNVSATTTAGSQTFQFDTIVTDRTNTTCKYSIYNSTGKIDGLSNNISFTCGVTKSATTTTYGTFNLSVTAWDYFNQSTQVNTSFTTSASSGGVTTGGGGGGGSSEETVIAIKLYDSFEGTLTDLQRAIIYAKIDEYLKNNTGFFKTKLSDPQINNLISILENIGIVLSFEELNKFIEQYNKNEIENVKVSENLVELYGLIKSGVVVGEVEFKVNPRVVSGRFRFVCGVQDIELEVIPNKALSSCEGFDNFKCNLVGSTQAIVYYDLKSDDFFSQTLKGEVRYVSVDDEVDITNIQSWNIINYCKEIDNTGIPVFVPFIFVFVVGSGLLFRYQTKVKSYLKGNRLIKSIKKRK